jgi:hypothetical protein
MATPVNSTPWQDKLIDYVISHSGALLSALVVIIIGLVAAGWIGKLMDRWLDASRQWNRRCAHYWFANREVAHICPGIGHCRLGHGRAWM